MKKLINFRPILFILLSLCCGITAMQFFMLSKVVWGVFFIAVFIVPLIIFMCFYTKKGVAVRNAIFSSIFIIFFLFGGVSFYLNLDDYNKANLNGNNYDITAKIIEAYQTETGHKFILDNAEICGNRSGKIKYKISLSVSGDTNIDIGDVITFNANLYDNSSVYEDKFNSNDIERGIKYYARVNAENITKTSTKLTIFEKINLFLRNSLKIGLGEREFSVGYALLTGNSNFMDNDLITSYRDAGVAHIFAVSGLHIGFLAGILILLLKKLKIKPIIRAIIITLTLLFYSGVCGFSASSLRATVMTSVMLFASLKGNRYDSLTALSLAGILILLISPMQLFCVGFQLSFMVVLGIIILAKPLAKCLKFLPTKIANALGVVITAQIFALPICLYAFSKVSTIAVIVNLIFIPIVSFIFILTLLATILGGIFGISNILLFPSNYIFKFINILIGAFDYKIFMFGGIVLGSGAIAYYLLFFVLGDIFNLRKIYKLIISCVLVCICTVTTIIVNTKTADNVTIYVTSCDTISATYIKTSEDNLLIVSDVEYVYSTSRLKKVASKTGCDDLDTLIVMGGYNVNLQQFITKMSSVYKLKNVYYYGYKNQEMEQICKVSFPQISLQNFYDGKVLSVPQIDLSFDMDGKVLIGDIAGKKSAIFSKLGDDNLDFSCLGNGYDIMVCLDRADMLLSRYLPKTSVSYKYSNIYQDAQSLGNICLKID